VKIGFLGTPEFCMPTLRALHASRHKVVCVVTQPDREGGRGRELIAPPAKKVALELGIPVLQPKSISKELDTVFANIEKPDILITCAFGQILRQSVIDFCKHGVVNVHASLLPKYRGACPINFVLTKGETQTGITIMQTDIGIDTGDILHIVKTDIAPTETAGELSARLADLGAKALLETLDQIEKGTAKRTPQDHTKSSYFPMLKKSDGKIDWTKSPTEIANFIRGMNPWPMAWSDSNYGVIRFHTPDIVQPAGGKPMNIKDFNNGHRDCKFH